MRILGILLVMICGFWGQTLANSLTDYVGDWAGDLTIAPGASLPLVLHISANDGEFTAALDSPAQGAFGIPVSEISVDEDGALDLVIAAIGANFHGVLTENGAMIEGVFTQNGTAFDLLLTKGAQTTERISRTQEPGLDRPYREEEITFSSKNGPKLAGTLVLPEGDGPYTGVVLLNGSGPQDRDEYLPLFNHKPFLVLSDHLARQGIASFRYDDRSTAESEGSFSTSIIDDFAADAAAALNLINARPDISKVGFLGHSEGGLTSALAYGDKGAKPHFIVTLAGPYKIIGEVLVEQTEVIALASGLSEADAKTASLQQRLFVDAVVNAATPEAACSVLNLLSAGADASQKAKIQELCTPYFWSLLRSDPAPHYAKFKGPVLALFGGKDVQVIADVHAPLARDIFDGRKNTEVVIFADKNHLFQTAETGAMSEYGEIEETMSPEVMSRIADWIAAH